MAEPTYLSLMQHLARQYAASDASAEARDALGTDPSPHLARFLIWADEFLGLNQPIGTTLAEGRVALQFQEIDPIPISSLDPMIAVQQQRPSPSQDPPGSPKVVKVTTGDNSSGRMQASHAVPMTRGQGGSSGPRRFGS